MTDSPGRQGAPKAETARRKMTGRQIAHARNQKGVVPDDTNAYAGKAKPTIARSKQNPIA